MKSLIFCAAIFLCFFTACSSTQNLSSIEPKSGSWDLPAKGEFRAWRNTTHSRFRVRLTNPSKTQSCELYYVTANGNEKWVTPSLLANSSLTVSIPIDGHLFIKNFNDNVLTISFQVEE
jgi:hypothetical protein